MQQEVPREKYSENDEANDAIHALRAAFQAAAKSLRELGNELEASRGEIGDLNGKLEMYEKDWADVQAVSEELRDIREIVADHRRGLLDNDELYARTVDAR